MLDLFHASDVTSFMYILSHMHDIVFVYVRHASVNDMASLHFVKMVIEGSLERCKVILYGLVHKPRDITWIVP